ncbi:Regulatory protein RecX [Corynebacterium occultum]|uniref:Regulatory protein RecX n=1 Tax=Corynebacterium occultum TaxID=2675219 RepID=A0A6B8VPX3_9CORY|nr:recombination regulator RecX [Corynebacterium occultum]QGU07632.1 Regulatory protein RecX [Corynebacterium occultum]
MGYEANSADSSRNARSVDPEKLTKLRRALEAYEAGQGPKLFDHQAEEAKAAVRKRALGLLDHRARSRRELKERLTDAEFEPAIIEDVLDDLQEAKLIDDQDFANEWVRQRHQRRGKSIRALDRELSQKGIDQNARDRALEQIGTEDEAAMARQLAEKKARSIKEIPADRSEHDKQLRRVAGVLARRGFPGPMSLQISREVLAERHRELE